MMAKIAPNKKDDAMTQIHFVVRKCFFHKIMARRQKVDKPVWNNVTADVIATTIREKK